MPANPNNYNTRSQNKVSQQPPVVEQPGTPNRPLQPIEPVILVEQDPADVPPVQPTEVLPVPEHGLISEPAEDIQEEAQETEEVDTINSESSLDIFSQLYMTMNNPVQLDNFKRQGEDPEKWWQYFQRYAAFMNMDESRGALALPFHLKGIAKSWYDSLTDTTQNLSAC